MFIFLIIFHPLTSTNGSPVLTSTVSSKLGSTSLKQKRLNINSSSIVFLDTLKNVKTFEKV